MDYKLRNKIWKRDNSTCQMCNKKLFEVVDLNQEAIDELASIRKIPIYKWIKKCWKCGKATPVVTYDFMDFGGYLIGSIEKLDFFLQQNYPFVKTKYSNTMEEDVIGNVCIHCDELQGNWFVSKDFMEMQMNEVDFSKLIDQNISNPLTVQDLYDNSELVLAKREKRELGEIHHKDSNPSNDDPDNLVLLCLSCHAKTKIETSKNQKSKKKKGI
jgi:hypothetical protein